MALPDLIEIVPLDKPVRAEITVPGSKSITNRALILAALADGEVTLEGALWSEDTQIMVECLQELGFMVNVAPDPNEICNRTITVYGQGGKVPGGGTAENPLELFVGNAGTAARFLAAFVCLGKGVYRLHGVPRMHERPQAALFQALRELGYRVDTPNDKLPAVIYGRDAVSASQISSPKIGDGGTPSLPRKCRVSIEESSQFASALLLCAKTGGWKIEVVGENAEESPYVAMTTKMIEAFPKNGGVFEIDSDASSASYFWGARFLLNGTTGPINYRITTPSWSQPELQIDTEFPGKLLLRDISRLHDLGDSIMTAITLAPTNQEISRFSDLKRLRLQETERVVALRTELTKCGAKVVEDGDTLTVYPSELHGAEIETYNDHRMAMCFAILGLKVPGIKIKNPACVKKTFPNFFQKLAAPAPKGLGATILDARTGRKLKEEDLFAE
ncbi:MAG: 3-phosphoshikimate 1-carboxyvinyltransferase [Verrucomicrobiota bacterium]|jgi:3-phosphoshikimate 1-carboxyvinyltransferase